MKILRHGRTTKEKECLNCQCLFTYTDLDLDYRQFENVAEDKLECHFCVKCPECGELLIHED